MRQAWVVLRDGRVIGVALVERVAKQAVLNCRRYDAVPKVVNGVTQPVDEPHHYEIKSKIVMTQKFVAPKGYDKENRVCSSRSTIPVKTAPKPLKTVL